MSDAWTLSYDSFQPAEERRREALCTLGNGYLATRGSAPEPGSGGYRGTYLAGCYDRLTSTVAGSQSDDESMVNVTDWLPWTYSVDGGAWFDLGDVIVLSYRQELDLRHGVLTRQVRYRDSADRTSRLVQRRFVDMADPHRAASSITLYAEDWSGSVRLRSGLDASVTNSGVDRYAQLADQHLRVLSLDADDAGILVADTATVQSQVRVVAAAAHVLVNGSTAAWRSVPDGGRLWSQIDIDIVAGTSLTVDKTVAYYTSRDHAISEPREAAVAAVQDAAAFDTMLEAHVLAWRQLWDGVRLRFGGPIDRLRAIRLHTSHLLQTMSPHTADLDVGVPARGLSGEAYRGHVFWDELFVLPTLTAWLPQVARGALTYRYRRLAQARRAARTAGHPGAMFPWQSGSDGREESPATHLNPRSGRWMPDHSRLAHHVGLAVAFNVWQYHRATGDREFLHGPGAEIIVEVARFFASLAHYDRSQDRYVIRGVIGPDEFHTRYPDSDRPGIDNNTYTNVMTAWVLRQAGEVLSELPEAQRSELSERLGLDPHEHSRWEHVMRRLAVPLLDNGMLAQFEGYQRLDELDWDHYRARYGNIQRLDRILEAEGHDINCYRASKQADVLMLLHLLPARELAEILTQLACPFDIAEIPHLIDYYLARTSHGSTLSSLVHAWVLARAHRRQAEHHLDQVLSADIADIQGGTTAEGIHLGAMAGSVDLVRRCFAGIEVHDDALLIEPRWPAELGTLELHQRYQGHSLSVLIRHDRLTISSRPGRQPPIVVRHNGIDHLLAAAGTVRITL